MSLDESVFVTMTVAAIAAERGNVIILTACVSDSRSRSRGLTTQSSLKCWLIPMIPSALDAGSAGGPGRDCGMRFDARGNKIDEGS